MDTGHPYKGIYLHISFWLYTEMSVYAIYPGYTEETETFLLSNLRFLLVIIAVYECKMAVLANFEGIVWAQSTHMRASIAKINLGFIQR